MTEEFLHYIWKFKLFNQLQLSTTEGESIEIIKAGDYNTDAGPDFFNAKIKIGKTLWAGNVEVHINASDWEKHSHQKNKAYGNIILHVVYSADKEIYQTTGEAIATLELKNLIPDDVLKNYNKLNTSIGWIPCEKLIKDASTLVINSTLDKVLIERLENKSQLIIQSLKLNKNNWEETFYQQMAKSFGFKTNAEPFELLAKSLPINILAKHKNNLLQIEALLFGQAGMLNEYYKDKYALSLQNEYAYLQKKFKLKPIDNHLWKFLRLRPANFPSIRIAQFASLIYKSSHLFSKVLEADTVKQLKKLLNTDISEYWQTHYVFDKITNKKQKTLGEDSVDIIIINTIVPFLFVYGQYKKEEIYVNRAIQFLEKINAENNSIIKKWESIGIKAKNAYDTQALLQLKNNYCSYKKCLECSIGNHLLKK